VLRLFNFLAYQLAWLACVLGAAHGWAWAGAAFALTVAAAHVALHRRAGDLKLIALAAAIGFLVDTALARSNHVEFASAGVSGWAPYWMVCLWIAFATTLNHSLQWIAQRPLVAAFAGAVGGPLAYLAGAKLGALQIAEPLAALTLTAMLWAVAMAILSIATRMQSAGATQRLPA
jgi:hypothetical protein